MIPDETPLAEIDGVRYVIRAYVYAIDDTGEHPVCAPSDWPATPIGRLAERELEIARLRARVAELEAELTDQLAVEVLAAARGLYPDAGVRLQVPRFVCVSCGQDDVAPASSLVTARRVCVECARRDAGEEAAA